jgi:glycosyltransferase involved in cell wall biosynthesis
VGRLVPAKGQHVLLAAVARLRASGRNLRLRLVGDGPDRASLQAAARRLSIEDAVIFEGAVNQDRIRDLYAKADVFALASFAEGIPVVLMEAMAMEIPCISTWITGIPELIRDSVDGLLVAPSDAEGLASAIARLMDDPELRARLGAAGRSRVIEKYDLRRNVARLADVFDARLGVTKREVVAA